MTTKAMAMTRDQSMETLTGSWSRRLRGFGPTGLLAIVVILAGNFVLAPLSALLVLSWARLSNTSWQELGFAAPRSWVRTVILGCGVGIALKFLMKAVVMPLLGAPPINQTYRYLAGNAASLPATVLTMIIVAGFGEETVYRGYLFERLGKLFGNGTAARFFIVIITSAWFALLHYPEQGIPGVEQAAITGTVFASMFAMTKRLWMPMIAHAVFDLTAVAMIYWNVEADVAHSIFR